MKVKKKSTRNEVNEPAQQEPNRTILNSVNGVVEAKFNEEFINHLAAIVESSTDAIISKSLDGVIKSWNTGSEKMFGYRSADMIGRNISLIIPEAYINEEKTILNKVLNNETIEPYETVRIKKNGQRLDVSLTISPLRDREGNIIGASTIGRDITLRKKHDADLRNANIELAFQNKEKEKREVELMALNVDLTIAESRLKEVNAELEAFTYSVSHDLRSPLRAINSYSQILIEDYGKTLPADGGRILENICYNSKKMGALIDDLLSFSRLGRKEIERTEIKMNEIIAAVLDNIERTTTHQAEIHVAQMPTITADYKLLYQVLINLVLNAVKYSSKKEHPMVEIFTKSQDGKIVFAVRDNGAGFNMRFSDKLFGVFQRLHSEKEFEGNGVGLAIVQRIISKHGGRVWGEGQEGQGATFYFTIN